MDALLIPLVIGSVAALVGWGLARGSRPLVAWVVALIGAVGVLVLWGLAVWTQGWDAIGYAIAAFLLLAPAALGCALGGLIEWIRRRLKGGGA